MMIWVLPLWPTTNGVFQVEEGTLYPALQRLLAKGWVGGEWKQTENNRRARYYNLERELAEALDKVNQ